MEELEKTVRESVEVGLKEFQRLRKGMDIDRAYIIAQTKAIKTFYDNMLKGYTGRMN